MDPAVKNPIEEAAEATHMTDA
jgi:hypothetical protein